MPRAGQSSMPTVADKTFLISIGDRSVGGLIVRDQMVGPWQVPVADCGVTAAAFDVFTGEAMAMGERTPVAVNNAAAFARLAVGEALTNLIIEHTHTCYRGDREQRHPWGYGCNDCFACNLRSAGYARYREAA